VPVDQINYNAHIIKLDNEYEIKKELTNLKTDVRAYELLIQKMIFVHVKLEQVDTRAANFIKKEIHELGGEAAISQEAYSFTERNTDVIISGSKKCLKILARKISGQQYGLTELAKEIEKCLSSNIGVMKIGDKILDFKHKTYVTGVVSYYKYNSFSTFSENRLLRKVELMIKAGVDIINISGENFSTGKNGEEEITDLGNLTHFIKEIKRLFPGILLSIDTGKYLIAKEAHNSGVDIINKSTPLKFNEDLINFVAQVKCPMTMTFSPPLNGGPPKPLVSISDVIKDIQSNVNYAMGKGIDKDKIIIDPGIGFGRSDKDNFLILKQLSSFKHLNLPIIVGLSKRSFLGDALKGKMKQTHISTIAANTLAIINGVNIIRVYTAEHVSMMSNIIDSIMRVDDIL
jgi:dihydropteroate synthase